MWLFLAGAYRRLRRAAESRRIQKAQQQRPQGPPSDDLSELSDPEVT